MIEYIDTPDALKRMADALCTEEAIAVDTEFLWTSTYYAIPGLIQIATPSRIALVDAVSLNSLDALAEPFSRPSVVKVLHDAPQDLRLLRRLTGTTPRSVFDTRTAAGFTNRSSTLSLAALLRDALGIDLPKDQTLTNWTRRPLTPAQLTYATDDVAHLLALRTHLRNEARAFGTLGFMDEEMALNDDPDLYEEDSPEDAARRVKIPPRLNTAQQGYIYTLAVWRELTARSENKARQRVLSDHAVASIGVHLPRTLHNLKSCKHVPHTIDRHAATLLAILNRPPLRPPLPAPAVPREWRPGKELVQAMMRIKDDIGQARRIDPQLIGARSDVEKLCANAAVGDMRYPCRLFDGWRWTVYGKQAMAAVASLSSEAAAATEAAQGDARE